jgi:phosphate starvation-inducible protein PhoH
MKAANLDPVRQKRIYELEKEIGCTVVALHPENQLAQLSKQQAERLAAVERELGVSLVAYESNASLRLAHTKVEQHREIEKTERATGLVLVAYEVVGEEPAEYVPDLSGEEAAKLSEDKLRRLHAAEQDVGLTLMAFQRSSS